MPDFQNPHQEPGNERRLLFVFVLTFLAIMAFQPLLKKYFPQPPAAPQNQTATTQPATAPADAAPANVDPYHEIDDHAVKTPTAFEQSLDQLAT